MCGKPADEKRIGKKGRKSSMLTSTIVMGAIAVILVIIGIQKGQGQHVSGLRSAMNLTVQVLPLVFFAFITAGMVQVLVPREVLAKWIGTESGMRGILLGTVAGGFSPGGPYVNIPTVAALLHSGAGAGTTVAFLTSWSVWAVTRLPMEVGLLGWRFTAIRLASTFFFPPLAGLIAQRFFGGVKLI